MLDARATTALLPWPALVRGLERVLNLKAAGLAQAPERLAVPLDDAGAVLLAMPAAGGGLAVTKLITIHPCNPARGLPLILGEVLVLDTSDGRRLGVLDGPTVTARRTAAVSLLAARKLAPETAGPLLLVGAGVQARAHLEAFHEGLGITTVFVSARSPESARALADHGRTLGLEVHVVASADDVLDRCPLVVTATTSPTPVLGATASLAIRPDAFVAAVGSFTPQAAELPAELVRRAALHVDDLAGARHEAGDFLQAGVDWATVAELAPDQPRPRTGPVVFKSVGCALWDLAAALAAFGK